MKITRMTRDEAKKMLARKKRKKSVSQHIQEKRNPKRKYVPRRSENLTEQEL